MKPPDPPAPAVRASDAAAAGCLPRKSCNIAVKSVEDDGTFTIYAAVFGNEDRQGDVIERGAFDNLDEFVLDGWIALSHDQLALAVAYPVSATQDEHGLKITGCFHSTPEAQAVRTVARERLAAGKAVKCSIGYVTREESFEKSDGRMVRRIKRLSIYEASFVNLPANPVAEATSVKGTDTMPETKDKPLAESKRSVAISAANRAKMAGFSEEMEAHHGEMKKCMKSMGECHKAMSATHGEFKSYMKSFEPDDDGDEDEDEAPAKKPRKKKEADPEDTADGDPPKTVNRESTARKLAALKRPQ